MSDLNMCQLIGRLGADPEMRYTGGGQGVCELRVATGEEWKDKAGAKQSRTSWHRVIVWGKTAEHCAKYLAKGRQVYIAGRIQYREFDAKDGSKRYVTEIVADDVKFLGSGKGGGQRDEAPPADAGGGGGFAAPVDDSDIPFLTCDVSAEPSGVASVLRRGV